MRLTLRDYQSQALDHVAAHESEGLRRLLGVAATGLGKTVMFCALAERMGCRTLILAHRDELIGQAAAKVREVWPEAPSVGRVQGQHDDVRAHVVVASVQTVQRDRRLERLADPRPDVFGGPEPFGLVVVDEAHHAAAASYRKIISKLRAGEPDGPLLLGVTATPDRGDGQGLDGVFDTVAFSYDILWGIRSGYLADLRGVRVQVDDLDLDDVKVSRGDYQAGDAGRALSESGAPQLIAEAWHQHAAGRRTLVFTPTVATALETRDAMLARGIRAAAVSGEMDMAERRSILRAFSAGELDAVVNCMVLTEGYDEPRVDCVIVARPTKSRALYTQMVGRGTRRHPDKTDCLVLDVVGVSRQHSLVTIPSLFGLPDALRRASEAGERSVSDLVAEHEAAEVAAGRLRAEEVELFEQLRDAMSWVATHRDGERRRYTLGIGKGRVLVLAQLDADVDDGWAVQVQEPNPADPKGPRLARGLMRGATLETCQGVGEDFARRYGSEHLVDPNAAWRGRSPSARQLHAARRWRLKDVDSYATAGELSDALSAHIERVRAKKARR